jgi:KaiC/GvpD/RAD55 family RecA-like ATPase
VIDATNERYKMFPPGASRVSEAEKYFQRVGTRLGRMEGQIGLHVVSESTEPGFDRILANIEDGCIVLRESTDEIGKKREIRVEHLRDGGYDDKWFEFRMGRNGIEVF